MKSKNIVGENIRKFRLSAGFTQEALANRSGLSQGYINQLENGKRNFTQKSLELIAGELQMDMYRLLMFCRASMSRSSFASSRRIAIYIPMKESILFRQWRGS